MEYKILIVDDETLARNLLAEYVSKIDFLHLVGCCTNAMEALNVLHQEKIDILLTDIQMPDITGIEMVSNLVSVPAVIFTTAYSEYAVDGYTLDVADYLLKPISFTRFMQAIQKAVLRVKAHKILQKIKDIPNETLNVSALQHIYQLGAEKFSKSAESDKDYITIKADFKLYKVNFDDLIYIEGQQEYVTFHTIQRNITAYYSLKSLEETLPDHLFVRIHKSYIVSIKYIDAVETKIVQIGKLKLPIGEKYRDNIFNLLT